MFFVYILFSPKLNRFYIGSTKLEPQIRLRQHNEGRFDGAFTAKGVPWELFLTIDTNSYDHARAIERHCKKMKSALFLRNLKQYPELLQKIKVHCIPLPVNPNDINDSVRATDA